MPPHDLEAEAAVLSAVLLEGDGVIVDECMPLTPEHFYSEAHARTWQAVMDLRSKNQPCDVVQVMGRLRDTGRLEQVGKGYLLEMLDAAPTGGLGRVRTYRNRVVSMARARTALRVYQEAAAKLYTDPGSFEVHLSDTLRALGEVGADEGSDVITLRDAAKVAFEAMTRGTTMGTSTGFSTLDGMTGGLHPGALIVVAGRPGMGKSAVVVNILTNVVKAGGGAYLWSGEMPAAQVGTRVLCSEGDVDLRHATTGRFLEREWSGLAGAIQGLGDKCLHFLIDQKARTTVAEIRGRIRRRMADLERRGVKLRVVAIDYIGLLVPERASDSRNNEVSGITRELKLMAMELGVTVIALSQLNRKCEERGDKRPMLSDLRDSGSVEQDADAVIMVYRHAYYHPESADESDAELIFVKQRSGPLGVCRVTWDGRTTSFRDTPEAFSHGGVADAA